MQGLIVSLIVTGCAGYAFWTLMPAAGRRLLAGAVLRFGLPLPAGWVQRLERATRAASGCGCDGCDKSPVNASHAGTPVEPAPQQIRFHPRPPR